MGVKECKKGNHEEKLVEKWFGRESLAHLARRR